MKIYLFLFVAFLIGISNVNANVFEDLKELVKKGWKKTAHELKHIKAKYNYLFGNYNDGENACILEAILMQNNLTAEERDKIGYNPTGFNKIKWDENKKECTIDIDYVPVCKDKNYPKCAVKRQPQRKTFPMEFNSSNFVKFNIYFLLFSLFSLIIFFKL